MDVQCDRNECSRRSAGPPGSGLGGPGVREETREKSTTVIIVKPMRSALNMIEAEPWYCPA